MQKVVNVVGKFFVLIFIIILVFGLVMWGIGDVLKGKGANTVAKIGNISVTDLEVAELVNSQKRRLSGNGMQEISPEFEDFLKQGAVRQLINTKLLENEISDLSIEFDENDLIKKDFDKDGKLDEELLQAQIANSGGEEAFLKDYLKEKKLDILESSLTSITPITDSYAKRFYNYNKQKRDITLISFDNSIVGNIPKPTENELKSFYDSHKESYRDAEYRSISYIIIDKNSVKSEESKPIDETLYQAANDLLDKLAEGASLEDSANELNLPINKIENISSEGKNKQGQIVEFPKIDKFLNSIFTTEEGQASDLLETPDGSLYAVLQVNSIVPSRVKALDEVRGLAAEDLKKNKLSQELYKKASEIKIRLDKNEITTANLSSIIGVSTSIKKDLARDSKNIDTNFLNMIFGAKKNGFTEVYVEENNAKIAKIESINYPTEPDEIELLETKSFLQDQISQDIMIQYVSYLASKYSVNVSDK